MKSKLKIQFQTYDIVGRSSTRYSFIGALLGASTSQTEVHTDHPDEYARRGEKCSACRWFEVYIYRRKTDVNVRSDAHTSADFDNYRAVYDYVVHTVGGSAVPREKRFSRVQGTTSPFDVIELLTVRPVDRDPFIAAQSARALAQAADLDDGIREAYINRAVV